MKGNGISEQGEKVIADFIHMLETEEDLKPKTVNYHHQISRCDAKGNKAKTSHD